MAKSWLDVQSSEKFKNAPLEEQQAVADAYFNKVIVPQVEAKGDDVNAVRQAFMDKVQYNNPKPQQTVLTPEQKAAIANGTYTEPLPAAAGYMPEVPQNETRGTQQTLSPSEMTPEEKAARANGVPFTPDLETPEFKQQRERANRAVNVTEADVAKEAAARKENPEAYKDVPEGKIAFDTAKRRKIGQEAEMMGTAFTAPLNPYGAVGGGLGLAGRLGAQGAIAAGNNAIGQLIGTGTINPSEAGTNFALGSLGQGVGEALVPAIRGTAQAVPKGLDLLANMAGVSNMKKAVGEGISNVANKVADTVLPEEVRTAQKAKSLAKTANKDTLETIAGAGDKARQDVVQKLIRDEEGNSLLTPMQMYKNTGKGKDIIQAEKTNYGQGGSQDYQNIYETQQSGSLFDNLIGNTNTARAGVKNPLDEALAADKAGAAVKYDEVMNKLNDQFSKFNNIKVKTPETNKVIDNIIDEETRLSSGVSASTKRFLDKQVKQFNPTSPEEINQLKTTINQRIGDNMVDGKPNANAKALMKVRDAYKTDTDNFMQGIGNGNLWREADQYYKAMMGDYSGKGNPITRVLKQDAEQGTFGNSFLSGQNAAYNTAKAVQALQGTAGRTSHDLSKEFSSGLGELSRANALEKAALNQDFNLSKLSGELNKQSKAVKAADTLAGTNELSKNQAISDVANIYKKYKTSGEYNPNVGSARANLEGLARGAAGFAGAGPMGILAAGVGAVDRLLGENALFNAKVYGNRIARDREFLMNPDNAQRVLNIINGEITPSKLKKAIDAVQSFNTTVTPRVIRAGTLGEEPQPIPNTPSTPQPTEEHKVPDVYNVPNPNINVSAKTEEVPETNFSKRTQILADAIMDAETGNERDPWIRTKVLGSGSSAAGPLQITGTLMEDMLERHPDLFTKEEKDYAEKYVKQSKLMLQNPDHPVVGYGGKGVLFNTDKQKKLYMNIGKKLLEQTYKDSGNNLNNFITRWRGVNASQDPRYHNLVNNNVIAGINRYS
ncbi:hypothetical protein [Citrobacter farmeri]|uniref:hypothetical protein n=1 Tax=Citrobacter farmeri TaxID=67824 RepID=UPI0019005992|nr:hypothetical protein [Citrobacter farmeri]MBJ9134438.1 hypothetical protein [Citrobacter farmeri]